MKVRKIVIPVLLLLAGAGLFLGWRSYLVRIRSVHPSLSVNSRDRIMYDATEELKKATDNYENEDFQDRSEEVEGYPASQRKVALVFAGLTTPTEMEQILDLLDEYGMKATFACDGITASEIPDTVNEIRTRGNTIANYGMNREEHWEQRSDEEIIDSVARAQSVLKRITQEYPDFVMGNATVVNEQILYLTACAGVKNYISATRFVNTSSFDDFGEALGFVEKIDAGSIICVKIDDHIDATEYEPYEVDERPADDKRPSLETDEETFALSDMNVIEVLLEALDTTETAVVPIDRLYEDPDPEIDRLFADRELAADYEIPRSAKQKPEFLGDALFIGDSLTLALSYYPVVDEHAEFCAYKSVTPTDFVNNVKVTDADGKKVAVWDEVCGKDPERIYLLLGTNALASGSNQSFLLYYEKLVEMLQERFPDVPIYVEGLPPVTESVSNTRVTLNNGRIRKVNVEIAKMAGNRNCFYIDLYTALADSGGALPAEIAQEDGIHMNQEGCQKWIDHLLTHKAKDDK
ncbi:MAG: polysaccharide deacetylase family protein [Lachnospiraceae bacterium]|nr:polysaccharide deacetylase family protein [Lachnospiraceae bacterium]